MIGPADKAPLQNRVHVHLPTATVPRDTPGFSTAIPDDSHPLLGSWAAVRWEYERLDRSHRVDVIADLHGTVTLSLSQASYVLACDLPPAGVASLGGTLRVRGDEWLDLTPTVGDPERLLFRRAAGTLVLQSERSSWDFTGGGPEPAAFTAVLVRL